MDSTNPPRLGNRGKGNKMVFKSSPVWTMSTESLVAHLNELDAPDQVYWDARELKKTFQKFQNLDWSNFPRVTKVDGQWTFA